jgi:hypothetical protein
LNALINAVIKRIDCDKCDTGKAPLRIRSPCYQQFQHAQTNALPCIFEPVGYVKLGEEVPCDKTIKTTVSVRKVSKRSLCSLVDLLSFKVSNILHSCLRFMWIEISGMVVDFGLAPGCIARAPRTGRRRHLS